MAAGGPLGDGEYPDFDVSKPNVARVYDAMLGGKDNFAADREFVAEVLRFAPMAPLGAISNRQFLRRVVQYLVVEAGVTQFIDLGSGLPTQGNVSEVAHQFNPRARVVHVDNDPIVYTHSKALLADAQTTDFVLGDVRRPREILTDPVVESMIDFGQPVGLLLFAVLHHLEDSDHPGRILTELRAAMPSASYLAISSLRLPGPELPQLRAVTIEVEKRHAGTLTGMRWREDSEISSWFGDWELVSPGLVPLGDWRPSVAGHASYPEIQQSFSGGVGRKR
ncbi:MAG TPA: SAM-dependent methyltransferase [Trebonia sp.]|nr:SAM-dependent methyltransferase [Trebonia sp.]